MLGVFWNPQNLLLLMGTEIFKIDASCILGWEIDENEGLKDYGANCILHCISLAVAKQSKEIFG